MHYYTEEKGSKIEVYFDPNLSRENTYEIAHIATIIVHKKGYIEKFRQEITRRWNFLIENRLIEKEIIDPKTGEVDYFLQRKGVCDE